MNKSTSILILIAFAISVSVSCTKVLDFRTDGIQPMLTMNAQFSTADSIHVVYLSISNEESISAINSGTVHCIVNGQSVGDSWPTEGDGCAVDGMKQTGFAFKARFQAGDVVRIEATADDGKYNVWSEVTVQEAPVFHVADTVRIKTDDSEEISRYGVTLKVEDIPCKDSFYSLSIYVPENGLSPKIEKVSPSIMMDGNVFSDNMFKDGTYTLSFTFSAYCFDVSGDDPETVDKTSGKALEVTMDSISKEEYYFLKSLSIYKNRSGLSAVTEPVSFPVNVNGGIGIVSIRNPSTATIKF